MALKPVTREEFDALYSRVEEAQQVSRQTNGLVKELHAALMEPQPGHDKSLLDRMAFVTIQIESGDRVAHWVLRIGGLVAAIGALYGAMKWGTPK